MRSYIHAVLKIANLHRNQSPENVWKEVNMKFEKWEEDQQKCFDGEIFDDKLFGVCYAGKRYESQAQCFYDVLRQCSSFDGVQEVMENSSKIVSLGCGPGPEIAAFLHYIRNDLSCASKKMEIVAVDRLDYWEPFIEAVAQLDDLVTVSFQKAFIDNQYLRSLPQSDICLISFCQVVKFENIWHSLKFKFSLIIVIDKFTNSLLKTVKIFGYNIIKCENIDGKTFFYYLNDKILSGKTVDDFNVVTYESRYQTMTGLCKRGIHEMNTNDKSCNMVINRTFECGHTFEVKCSELERHLQCPKFVHLKCKQNLHEKVVLCKNSHFYYYENCMELVDFKLPCGHVQIVPCYQLTLNVILNCSKVVMKNCNRNIHQCKVRCCDSFVCNKLTIVRLYCGHSITVKCSHLDSLPSNLVCTEVVSKMCYRGVHKHFVPCNTNPICDTMVEKYLHCGHTVNVKCDDFQTYNDFCNKYKSIKCNNNLHECKVRCGSSFFCSEEITVKMFCGHTLKKVCKDIDFTKCYEMECDWNKSCGHKCFVKCVCKNFELDLLIEENDMNNYEYFSNICCHTEEENCDKVCNALLICGHHCQYKCKECLRGRLHGRCVVKCERTMACGHKCSEKCHDGECLQCYDNCMRSRLSNFSIHNRSNYIMMKKKWQNLVNSLHRNSFKTINVFSHLFLMNLKRNKHSRKVLKYYKSTFPFNVRILTFYDYIFNVAKRSKFEKYTEFFKNRLQKLINLICVNEGCLPNSLMNDIIWEFVKLKDMDLICRLADAAGKADLESDVAKYIEILEKLITIKYNKDYRLKVIEDTNAIFLCL